MENKTLVYKVTFQTPFGAFFAEGTYKTRKAMRRAQDRYEQRYGACLITLVEMVAAPELAGIPCSNMGEFDAL